jgi:hypothetical protein
LPQKNNFLDYFIDNFASFDYHKNQQEAARRRNRIDVMPLYFSQR